MKQLSEEYATILENVQKTYKVLEARKSVIPELKKTAQEAQSKFKGAQKALQTQDKVVELNRELAWAYVKDREKVGEFHDQACKLLKSRA